MFTHGSLMVPLMVSAVPFRSFDLLKKKSISCRALLEELPLPSSTFSPSVDMLTKTRSLSSGVDHKHADGSTRGHSLGLIWAANHYPSCWRAYNSSFHLSIPTIYLHIDLSLAATQHHHVVFVAISIIFCNSEIEPFSLWAMIYISL